MLRAVSLTVALVAGASAPVLAAGSSEGGRPATTLSAAIERAASDAATSTPSWAIDRPERRPATLPVLYGAYAGLQALDVVTTKRALAAGATEANPLLKSGGARTFAIKTAAGAATIFFAERAWKKNRVGAVVLMAVLNGASAAIVARNARHAAR